MKIRFRAVAVFTLTSMLTLAGCGSDDNTAGSTQSAAEPTVENCAAGTISGAGSTFVQTIAQQWIKDYTATCTGSTVNYQGVGSGAGIQQLLSGTVDFAGSDVPLSESELAAAKAKYTDVVEFPWSSGGIAVEYNLPTVQEVKLSASTLAKMFSGVVTKWDDPAIKAENDSVTLPSTPIQVVHRSDGSGTTAAFTAFLAAAAPSDWKLGTGKEVAWTTGQGAKGSDGVTAAVKATDGAISYAEVSYAKANSLGLAKIKNAAGNFTAPESANVTAALSTSKVDDSGKVGLDYTSKDKDAYPISTVTYFIAPKAPADAAKVALVKSFGLYALSGGQSSASSLYYAALPNSLLTKATAVAGSIGAAG